MDEAVIAGGGQHCPHCGESMPAGSRFCENCGTELLAPAPASATTGGGTVNAGDAGADDLAANAGGSEASGATEPADLPQESKPCSGCGGQVAADGYCDQCGKIASTDRDHWVEQPASWVAGVCDRGLRHSKNEDAMWVGASDSWDYAALVVCDGVTSAPGSEVASLAAAKAAGRTLLEDAGTVIAQLQSAALDDLVEVEPSTAPDPVRTLRGLLVQAAVDADQAIAETVGDMTGVENPPSCTFVAAVVAGPLIVTGWIGDSRAYWLPDDDEPRQLSIDDSWAQEMIRQGADRADAESAPQAHAITRWLGPDAPDVTAQTMHLRPRQPGWLLVCSDGLWNYASSPADMAAVFGAAIEKAGADPRGIAENLVAWANECGGRDNITTVVARHPAHATPVSSTSVDH